MPGFSVRWTSIAAAGAAVLVALTMSASPAQARRHHYGLHGHHGAHRTVYYHAQKRTHHAHRAATGGMGGMHTGFAEIVVDANSGKTIFARNEHEQLHPASVTKVMTLYLLFEQLEKGRLRLDSPLVISAHANAQAPSKLGLEPGETITVENAIKAVVTKSANDVAVAIAENIGGDEESFARMMTDKAHAIGMRRSHFANASGLPNPTQLTTAYDLAVLGRAIQDRYPKYYRYFSTHVFAYRGALHRNHNHLLGRVEGMDGIKTGYTAASGFNLLTSVRRGNHHIVAVVLGGRTAAVRDRIMADLIEEHIDGGSATRTARAITEDTPDDAGPAAVAERDEGDAAAEDTVVKAAPAQVRASAVDRPAATPVALVSTTTTTAASTVAPAVVEKSDKPRPAFVPGVQKHVETIEEPKKGRHAAAMAAAKAKQFAAIDGSTTSSIARSAHQTATTPSAIRHAEEKAKSDKPAPGGWVIQIGAAEDAGKANAMLSRARAHVPGSAKAFTEKVQKGKETLYRARFAGLEEQSAQSACKALKRSGFSCFATKN